MRIANFTRCFALLAPLFFVPAMAEDAVDLSGNLDRERAFSIDAQALDAALLDFSDQANVQIMVATSTVEGLQTEGVEGRLTPRSALTTLLNDNDLRFTEVGNTIAVTSADRHGGNSDPKNSSPKPVLMTQYRASRTQAGASTETNNSLETSEPQTSQPAQPLEEIIVTGTNIRGVENPTTPVLQFDRTDIDVSGAATVEDFLRTIPQNFGADTPIANDSANPNDTGLNVTQGTAVDLRGLGAGSTLVLLNGRRMTVSGTGSFVDVSVLPLGAVERVDVLTDGASAVYGSDAVGGVVNFITRDDFEGLEANARYATVSNGSREEAGFGVSGGASWSSGGAFVGLDYLDTKPLLSSERDFIDIAVANPQGTLGPETRKLSIAGSASQSITERFSAHVDFLYSDREFTALQNGLSQLEFRGDQEAVFVNSRLEFDLSSDIVVTLFVDLAQEEAVDRDSSDNFEVPSRYLNEQSVVELQLSGSIFDMPTGSVGFALGGSHRVEDHEFRIAAASNTDGDRDVTALYAEFLIPLVSEEVGFPLANSVQLSLAGRYEDYSDFGETFNPKVGVYWGLGDSLAFRATYSESFRAPTLQSLNRSPTVTLSPFPDFVFTGGQILPAQDPRLPDGVYSVLRVSGGNPFLKEETAETRSAGFELTPSAIPGLTIGIGYFSVEYEDRIEIVNLFDPIRIPEFGDLLDIPPILSDVEQLFSLQDQLGVNFENQLPFDPVPADIQINLQNGLQNLSSREVEGLDFSFAYDRETSVGSFSFGLNATYISSFDTQVSESSKPVGQVDTLYRPIDLKLRSSVSWSRDGWTVFGAINHQDSYRDVPDQSSSTGIDSWTTFDLSFIHETGNSSDRVVLNEWRFSATVQNILDEDPPFIETPLDGLNYDPTNANPFGRVISFAVSRRF